MKLTHTEFLGLQANVAHLGKQLKTGEYIVLEPASPNGYGFAATFSDPDAEDTRIKTRGFGTSLRAVAALAKRLAQPVVLSEGVSAWREQVGSRLHNAGVTVITEWAEED